MTGRCPTCGRPTSDGQRWCGSCGASLPARLDAPPDTEPGATETASVGDGTGHRVDPAAGAEATRARPEVVVKRRRLLALGGASVLGLATGWLVRGPGGDPWLDAGPVTDLLATIERDRWAPVPGFVDPAVHGVVRWDPSIVTGDRLESRIVYASEPVVERTVGLMVLVLRSTHGGCDVTMCASSGWFEDVCFGSKFNNWGEWTGGPAPRGLDRRPSRIVDGRLQVSRSGFTTGVHREASVLRSEPLGPPCIEF